MVLITLTEKGRALQEQAKDIPQQVGGCIELPSEKAQVLYTLLYELLDKQGYQQTKHAKGDKK